MAGSKTAVSTDDLAYCHQRVLTPDSLLTVTLRFAEPDLRESLIILHSVLREIRAIPFTASQPEPALAKLSWWQNSILEAKTATSQHPSIRALKNGGLLEKIGEETWAAYIMAASRLSMGEPVEDQSELAKYAELLGGSAACMEQLLSSGETCELTSAVGVADFACWSMSNFDRLLAGENWWLPLDTQARFGVGPQDLQDSGARQQIMSAIAFQAAQFRDMVKLHQDESSPDNHESRLSRHLFIAYAVNQNRLEKLSRSAERYWPLRNRPGDMWDAWKSMRRHQRLVG